MIRPVTMALILGCSVIASQARADTVTLNFLPPVMEPRDICSRSRTLQVPDDQSVGASETKLSDADRIRFLRRDIRQHMQEDAARYFDFIDALIARRGEADPDFTPVDQGLARVDLWLRANRLEDLKAAGLIEDLRAQIGEMTNNQRVTLARFYAEGLGVEQDVAFAQELIREAAYGGNARALLEIARLAQDGTLIEGWEAPLDLTVTMAFGGILGALDSGVCLRAEQIAQAYLKGDVVTQNSALALAWFRFAADMGRAESAWRVVEFYLNADASQQDNVALRRYLEQAVRLGIAVPDDAQSALVNSGAVTANDLARMLGFNHPQDAGRTRKSIASYLQLSVKIDSDEAGGASMLEKYLREIALMPEAPGRVFDRLAGDVLISRGRWAGEAEAMALLEEGAARGDPRAMRRLARMLLRYRDDPAQVARAESLLMEVVARHGVPDAMRDLDTLYRCQVTDAPRLTQADIWATQYKASGHKAVSIDATDLMALTPSRSPEAIARIQSLSLNRRATMVAMQAQRVQSNPLASDAALRFWAEQTNRSSRALEDFAKLEFDLATTPAERDVAIELFRRVHLHNGVTTALDLAVALTAYDARNPAVAQEIGALLTRAASRGEGNSMRLLARLQSGTRGAQSVYDQFAQVIDERGDFLALMFAVPFVSGEKADDYIDRAVSLMACGTKDVAELSDAHARRNDPERSYHWTKVGLHFEGGHTLSKLRLSDRQTGFFGRGSAPAPDDLARRALAEGDTGALMRLVELTANSALETYDPDAAVTHMVAAINRAGPADMTTLAELYRAAPSEVRDGVDAVVDFSAVLERTAARGDAAGAYEYGLLLLSRARSEADLTKAYAQILNAAERGNRDAMYETGKALGLGLGQPVDHAQSVKWLDQAAAAGHPQAGDLARLMRIKGGL